MNELLEAITRIDTRVVLVAALLVLDIWAIGMTIASGAGVKEKVLWSGIVILCPIFGCLFWFSLGPKPNLIGTSASSVGHREAD